MIIFYDIPSTLPKNAWSPNTWKARYCLNYKGIPYKTEWIEYPDIEGHCKKLGIPPTFPPKPNGSPNYTLPAIHDPSTGAYISDSLAIAEYLEKTYPNTPSLFPNNTITLQRSFQHAFMTGFGPLRSFLLPSLCDKLNPRSAEYFRRTREEAFGMKLEEVFPTADAKAAAWAKAKAGLATIDQWYAEGPFVLGDTLSWADFVVAGYIIWNRTVWGEGSQQWQDLSSWHDGRWAKVLKSVENYERIV